VDRVPGEHEEAAALDGVLEDLERRLDKRGAGRIGALADDRQDIGRSQARQPEVLDLLVHVPQELPLRQRHRCLSLVLLRIPPQRTFLTANACSCRTYVPMIAAVVIPAFDLRAALRLRPALEAKPAALAPLPGTEPLVGSVTAAAEAKGVRP